MGLNFRQFSTGVKIIPDTLTSTAAGELQVDITTSRLSYHNGSTRSPIVTQTSTDTLTNKSIDADTNTITNIENADIKTGAAIDRSKLASGTAYRILANDSSGVSSENAAITAAHVVYADANGQLAGEAALAKSRGGTGADNSSVTFPSTGTIVTRTATETLTNKTIDADSNTITNIENADIKVGAAIARSKLASGTADHVVINAADGSFSSEAALSKTRGGTGTSSTATFPTSGVVVTEAGTQTLTNKTLSGNTATNLISGSGTLTLNTTGTVSLPNATDTLVGKATTDTLTNKTLTGNTAANLISGSGTTTFNTTGTVSLPNATDTLVGKATTDTLTNKTISRSSNTLSGYTTNAVPTADGSGNLGAGVAPGTAGNVLTSTGSAWASSTPSTAPDQSYEISNLGLATSVAANALTIDLKDKSGSNPSGASPVKIGFRSTTSATGTYSQVSATAATSIVVTSGATLGHTSAVNQYVWVYALNNAGTIELAVSGVKLFDDYSIQSTTIMNSSSDSGTVLYSTTARSNVAIRLIGRLLVNQTTAGTWASAPTEVSLVSGRQPVTTTDFEAFSGSITGSGGGTLNIGTGGSAIQSFSYSRQGQELIARYIVRIGTSGATDVTGTYIFPFPSGLVSADPARTVIGYGDIMATNTESCVARLIARRYTNGFLLDVSDSNLLNAGGALFNNTNQLTVYVRTIISGWSTNGP